MNYTKLYKDTYDSGYYVMTRNGEARQLLNQQWTYPSRTTYKRPGDNHAIGLVEGLQFIAGSSDLEAVRAAAPRVDLSLFGANSFYGPRAMGQLFEAVARLRLKRANRRAVVMLAKRDEPEARLPCTLSLQFQVQDNALWTTVVMRSTDLIWGAPYDMVQFSMVHEAVSRCVGVEQGLVTVFTANAHIYSSTAKDPRLFTHAAFQMPVYFDEWYDWQAWARDEVQKYRTGEELLKYFNFNS